MIPHAVAVSDIAVTLLRARMAGRSPTATSGTLASGTSAASEAPLASAAAPQFPVSPAAGCLRVSLMNGLLSCLGGGGEQFDSNTRGECLPLRPFRVHGASEAAALRSYDRAGRPLPLFPGAATGVRVCRDGLS